MKAFLLAAAFVGGTLFLSSCGEKASGPVVTETRNLADFDRLTVDIPGRVEIHIGNDSKAEITVEEAVLDLLETNVSSGRLQIRFSKSVHDLENLVIKITVPSLSRVDLDGSGDIVCDDLLKGQNIDINLNGSGDIDFSNVDFSSIDASVHGSGNLQLAGKTLDFSGLIFGSGNLQALETVAEKATIENSGSGNATVSVNSVLKAKITGSGNISYRGNPAQIDETTTGSGRLIKID